MATSHNTTTKALSLISELGNTYEMLTSELSFVTVVGNCWLWERGDLVCLRGVNFEGGRYLAEFVVNKSDDLASVPVADFEWHMEKMISEAAPGKTTSH